MLNTNSNIIIDHKYPYLGCYHDLSSNVRDLNGPNYENSITNTIELCINFCLTNSYAYAGLQQQ